jgi:hypothetical protein
MPITGIPVASLVELSWPARLRPVPQVIRGRAFAGENQVTAVEYRIDEGMSCGEIGCHSAVYRLIHGRRSFH